MKTTNTFSLHVLIAVSHLPQRVLVCHWQSLGGGRVTARPTPKRRTAAEMSHLFAPVSFSKQVEKAIGSRLSGQSLLISCSVGRHCLQTWCSVHLVLY